MWLEGCLIQVGFNAFRTQDVCDVALEMVEHRNRRAAGIIDIRMTPGGLTR